MTASFEQNENRTEPNSFFAASDNRFLRVAFFSNAVDGGARRRNEYGVIAPSTAVIVSARGRQRSFRSVGRHARGPRTAAVSIRHR